MASLSETQASINHRNPIINSNSFSTTPKFPFSSSRSQSLSSFSSLSSSSSTTTTTTTTTSSPPPSPGEGIPFSWESFPGIPKTQILKKMDSLHDHTHLPLPPAPVSNIVNHQNKSITSTNDPFFVALVECSKGHHNGNKTMFGSISKGANKGRSTPGRKLSDRFGFVNNMSCKNFSSITESVVFLPRAIGSGTGPRRIAYDVPKKRAG